MKNSSSIHTLYLIMSGLTFEELLRLDTDGVSSIADAIEDFSNDVRATADRLRMVSEIQISH